MKIDFFETEKGLDSRAIQGGVYQVELLMEGKEPICLYIGESAWIASRCGIHLFSLYENPAYFGLTEEDLNNEQLTLRFSVIKDIKEKKSTLGVGSYKDQERDEIKKYKPLTQLNTSDRQIRDINEKVRRVQDKLRENGYKKPSE